MRQSYRGLAFKPMAVSSLKPVSHTLCPYVQRAVITLHEKQIPHEREYVDLAQKPAWFLALSPLGKVPLLLVGDTGLFESAKGMVRQARSAE